MRLARGQGTGVSPHTQDDLDRMLTRLKLTAVRDQLDSLLDEAVRSELTPREALAFLCEREIARKDQRRIDMSFGLAKFPFVRDIASAHRKMLDLPRAADYPVQTALGNRLTVDPRTLTPLVLVRIQVPQPA